MYQLDILKDRHLINWSVLYWGIKKSLIEPGTAIEYANKFVEDNPNENNPEIIELLIVDNANKEDVLLLLNKIMLDKKLQSKQDCSMLILRYAILTNLQRTIKTNQKLLSAIEGVYSDFDYPADMDKFIRYMPVQDKNYDTSKHTQEENEQHLIDNFNEFIIQEYQRILLLCD